MCSEHGHWHHDYVRLAWDSGFTFDSHKAKSNFDWSSVGIVDVEGIVRDRDVAVVEKHLATVTNYRLEPERAKILDPTFVKIFRLGQLSVQYLQFCKRYLDNTVVLLKKELAKNREENKELKEHTERLESEIIELKEKLNSLKESIQTQTFVVDSGNAFKCPTCCKMFLSEEYLIAHMKRRHDNHTSFQSETDKLQLEIKELKERLNSTEKLIQTDHYSKPESIPNNNDRKSESEQKEIRVDLLLFKFDDLKQYVERELTLLRTEKCNERYERWLEIVFKRLDSSKKELQNEKYEEGDICTGDGFSEKKKTDNVTQTGSIVLKDIQVMTESVAVIEQKEVRNESPILEKELKKLQEDLYVNTEHQLGQIQDALEQKLTGGLNQIRSQLNTFCEKLNKIEERNSPTLQKTYSPTVKKKSPPLVVLSKPKLPKPAPRITRSLPLVKDDKPVVSHKSVERLESKPFHKAAAICLEVEEETYSSMSEDERAFVPQESNHLNFKEADLEDIEESVSMEMETLYEKSQRDLLTKSELSDDEKVVATPIKPSTSTLGKRSISSLKQLGKDEQVIDGLKKELEEILYLKLKEVGVSPVWKRLPEKSYVRAMGIIQHQSEIVAKKYPNYYKIKRKLVKNVNGTLKKNTKNRPHGVAKKSKLSLDSKKLSDSDEEVPHKNGSRLTVKETRKIKMPELTESKMSTSSTKPKKVIFDLEESLNLSIKKTQHKKTDLNGVNEETSESMMSSILDGRNTSSLKKRGKEAEKELNSDWELSDIS